ncbi:MAG: SDR family oxidoreductase, partial [Gammaproteobacteria bacterium]|nr:SDR family oxidoreductase [Gammaproteobacteria bacterium]
AQGAKVVVVDRNEPGAEAIAEEIGGLAIGCNVASEASVESMLTRASEALGPIDILFNNAGVLSGSDLLSTPLDQWQDLWQVNVMAHVYATRAVLPSMLARGSGYLIHTASMAGILMSQRNLPYTVTKHAVVGLAEWLAVNYHDQGIRVSMLAPLGVRTPMLGDTDSAYARNSVGPVKEPEEVAQQVIEAVQAERFLILTDEVAQTWMERKTNDIERWLTGMRRNRQRIEQGS